VLNCKISNVLPLLQNIPHSQSSAGRAKLQGITVLMVKPASKQERICEGR
jgi:hypothetical protein